MERLAFGRDHVVVGRAVQPRRQLGNGRVLIDVAHRDVRHHRVAPDAGAEARHQQRVRAEVVEEMVLGRNALELEDVGQRGRQDALAVGLRFDVISFRVIAPALRLRQLFAIRLAADQHRNEGQLFQEGRHHVGRQPAAQRRRDLAARQLRALLERIIGDELRHARLGLVGGDRRLPDLRQFQQHRLDFGCLDAITADLHLGVDAAVIFDLATGVDAAEIAGAVDTLGRIVGDAEEIRDELLRRQLVAVHVAGGEPDAGDADFAQFAGRHRARLVGIENDDRIGRQRPADGDRLVRHQFRHRAGDGGFGRAVGIQDGPSGTMPAPHQILRAGFAADQQNAQLRQFFFDRRQQGRAAGHAGDLALAQECAELVADQAATRPRGNERRARHQRHPDLLDREVEGDGHALIDAVLRAEAVERGRDADEIADARVLDDDTLRIAGRSRGVNDVADLIDRRRDLAVRQAPRRFGVDLRASAVEQHEFDVDRRELFLERRHRHDGAQVRIGRDELNALARKAGIERHIGGVDFHHRQQRNIGFDGAVEQQADAIAGGDALAQQETRELVGASVEFPVAQDRVVGDNRVFRSELLAALFDQVMEPLARAPTNGVVLIAARRRRSSDQRERRRGGLDAAHVRATGMRGALPVGRQTRTGWGELKVADQGTALLLRRAAHETPTGPANDRNPRLQKQPVQAIAQRDLQWKLRFPPLRHFALSAGSISLGGKMDGPT